MSRSHGHFYKRGCDPNDFSTEHENHGRTLGNVAATRPPDAHKIYHHQNSLGLWNPSKTTHKDLRFQHSMVLDQTCPHHTIIAHLNFTALPLHGSNIISTRNAETNPKQMMKSKSAGAKRYLENNAGEEDVKSLYHTKHFWNDLKRLPSEGGTK